jgi:hypothetical protein
MIVDYDGRVLAQAEAGSGDKIVVGPVDLAALRAERQRRRGHNMLSHLRMEAYPSYGQPVFPSGQYNDGKITIESNEAAISQGREALKRIQHGRW